MKWFTILLLAFTMLSCSTTQTEDVINCDRMITCTLVGCNGEDFGTVDVPACDAELFERGCCQPLPDITCNCPDN